MKPETRNEKRETRNNLSSDYEIPAHRLPILRFDNKIIGIIEQWIAIIIQTIPGVVIVGVFIYLCSSPVKNGKFCCTKCFKTPEYKIFVVWISIRGNKSRYYKIMNSDCQIIISSQTNTICNSP